MKKRKASSWLLHTVRKYEFLFFWIFWKKLTTCFTTCFLNVCSGNKKNTNIEKVFSMLLKTRFLLWFYLIVTYSGKIWDSHFFLKALKNNLPPFSWMFVREKLNFHFFPILQLITCVLLMCILTKGELKFILKT